MKKVIINKTLYIIGLIIILYVNLFGRAYGLYLNFIVSGFINFFLSYYLLKLNPFKKIGIFLIFLPFLLLLPTTIYGAISNQRMPGIVGFIIYIVSSIFGIIVFKTEKKVIYIILYFLSFIILTINYFNILNYYYYRFDQNKIIGEIVPKIFLKDEFGNSSIILVNNKIQVIDLWSNSCAECIKQFPKFEELKNKYKNDDEVDFYGLNVMEKNQDFERSKSFLSNYTFKNFYTNKDIFKKLNFSAVPYYMIINKKGKIIYFGSLNVEKNETYNNIYNLIENEK